MTTAGQQPGANSTPAIRRGVLVLCAFSALFEGFDNQSIGVAAPMLVPELGLSQLQTTLALLSAPLGLFLGAAIGGRLADRVGRKRALVFSMLLLGVCSLLTGMASGALSLLVARMLTGLGLGGAMPNFIALASESTPAEKRVSSVAVLMAALPVGGVLAGVVALGQGLGYDWRMIFVVGGVGPVLLALLLWRLLPDDHLAAVAARGAHSSAQVPLESFTSVLFGSGRAATTLTLWGGFFFTQLVLLLMLNWLPTLFEGLGHTRAQASIAAICFNFAGAGCTFWLGRAHAGSRRKLWVVLTYLGMALSLAAIPLAGQSLYLAFVAVALAGVFTVGAQMILFALAPLYYERAIRGTGVGAAVSVGRLGSIFGPTYAGLLLAAGGGSAAVLVGIVPFVAIGGAAALALAFRPQCSSD